MAAAIRCRYRTPPRFRVITVGELLDLEELRASDRTRLESLAAAGRAAQARRRTVRLAGRIVAELGRMADEDPAVCDCGRPLEGHPPLPRPAPLRMPSADLPLRRSAGRNADGTIMRSSSSACLGARSIEGGEPEPSRLPVDHPNAP